MLCAKIFLNKFEAYTLMCRCRGKKEEEGIVKNEEEQDKASQQLALSASSGCNEGTPARSLAFDLPRVRGVPGESGGAGKSGTAKDERKRPLSNIKSTCGTRCLIGGLVKGERLKELVVKRKEKRDSQNKDPRTFESKQPEKGPKNKQRTTGKVASSEEAKGEEVEEEKEKGKA